MASKATASKATWIHKGKPLTGTIQVIKVAFPDVTTRELKAFSAAERTASVQVPVVMEPQVRVEIDGGIQSVPGRIPAMPRVPVDSQPPIDGRRILKTERRPCAPILDVRAT